MSLSDRHAEKTIGGSFITLLQERLSPLTCMRIHRAALTGVRTSPLAVAPIQAIPAMSPVRLFSDLVQRPLLSLSAHERKSRGHCKADANDPVRRSGLALKVRPGEDCNRYGGYLEITDGKDGGREP
jgi:hypothetical protein